jgi:TonB family protein
MEPVASSAPAPVDEEMAHYALAVRLALGRAARDHAGPKGRVEIAFGLDRQGGVRTADITRSSGNPDLDAAALALVRTTGFPQPPVSSRDGQLSYVIPIEFR